MNKKSHILADIKKVAAELGRSPTRDEYLGKAGDTKRGVFTEHSIRMHFKGQWSVALAEAGLAPPALLSVNSEPGYLLARAKAEIESLKKHIRKLERDHVSSQSIRDLIGAEDTTKLGEGAAWMKGPRESKGSFTGIPTLFLSDIHFDEVVVREQVNGANEYNHEIAVERIKHTFTTAVDLCKKHLAKTKYDGFICALGGDLLSGNIHEELAETNDQVINQSILDITDLLVEGISGLADEFGKVFVPCVVGNHGRHHRKPRFKFKVQNNYEWLVYQYISRHFKSDSRVSILIPDSPDAHWTVYGRKYCLNHGDQFSGGAGIAGVFSPLMLGMARKQKKQNAIGQPFDVMMNGHWHQYIHTDSLIINGSIKGYDEYADNHNFPYEPPQQALFIDHPDKRTTFRMPILCDASAKKWTGPKLSW